MGAANALLDRGWGKASQTVTQNINEKRSALDWTTDELVAFLNDRRADREGTAETSEGEDGPDSVH